MLEKVEKQINFILKTWSWSYTKSELSSMPRRPEMESKPSCTEWLPNPNTKIYKTKNPGAPTSLTSPATCSQGAWADAPTPRDASGSRARLARPLGLERM